MEIEKFLLSSPYGYYGEVGLWPFWNRQFATASWGDPEVKAANRRSHFTGIRLLHDANSWRCEASLEFSPAIQAMWISFAELAGPQSDESVSRTFFRSDAERISDRKKFDTIEVSPSLTEACADYVQANERHRKSADALSEHLAINVARFVEGIEPVYHQNYELPSCDASFLIMSDWIDVNQEKLLKLKFEQVNDLLTDAASELLRRFHETSSQSDPHWRDKPLDLRIELFLMATSDFFSFLSRTLKLHWYLGHDDWSDVTRSLDGGFPRTPPLPQAWILNLRDDAPWWAMYRRAAAQQGEHDVRAFDDDENELRQHDLISLSRAWLWPEVCRLTKESMNGGDLVRLKWILPHDTNSVAWTFRKYLAKFADWWTYKHTENAIEPICVAVDDLDNADPDDTVDDLLDTWGTSLVSPTMLAVYRKEVVESENWHQKHDDAFPRIGANLSIEELLKKDRLGFALKKFETEAEGQSAWARVVQNAVFEDAYGPRAIALTIEEKLRHKLFSAFGRNAIPFAFKDKSDHCQLMLREVVRRLLTGRHGDRWLNSGIPSVQPNDDKIERARQRVASNIRDQKRHEELLTNRISEGDYLSWAGMDDYIAVLINEDKKRAVRERIASKMMNKDRKKLDELSAGTISIDDFLRWADISDYIDILQDERNGIVVRGDPRLAYFDRPLKGSLSMFRKWNEKRIAAAHPEKADELTLADVVFLDEIKRILGISLLQDEPIQ